MRSPEVSITRAINGWVWRVPLGRTGHWRLVHWSYSDRGTPAVGIATVGQDRSGRVIVQTGLPRFVREAIRRWAKSDLTAQRGCWYHGPGGAGGCPRCMAIERRWVAK